jgi:hypothetical protein
MLYFYLLKWSNYGYKGKDKKGRRSMWVKGIEVKKIKRKVE